MDVLVTSKYEEDPIKNEGATAYANGKKRISAYAEILAMGN